MYKQPKAAGLEGQIQVPLICLTLKFRLLTSGTSCHVVKAVGIWKKKNSVPPGHRQGSKFSLFLSWWEPPRDCLLQVLNSWNEVQTRKTIFPWARATKLSVSPVWEQFWCSTYATDHLWSSVFVSSSDLPLRPFDAEPGSSPPYLAPDSALPRLPVSHAGCLMAR